MEYIFISSLYFVINVIERGIVLYSLLLVKIFSIK